MSRRTDPTQEEERATDFYLLDRFWAPLGGVKRTENNGDLEHRVRRVAGAVQEAEREEARATALRDGWESIWQEQA